MNKTKEKERPKNFVVLSYVHRLLQWLKKMGQRHDVGVVLSAPENLSRLCRRLNSPRQELCVKKRANVFVKC